MTRTVNIEVYRDGPEQEIFAVLSDHRPDLPKFHDELQRWAADEFEHIAPGEAIRKAGIMEYEPNEEILEFRRRSKGPEGGTTGGNTER